MVTSKVSENRSAGSVKNILASRHAGASGWVADSLTAVVLIMNDLDEVPEIAVMLDN